MNKVEGYERLISHFEQDGGMSSTELSERSEQGLLNWLQVHQDVETVLFEELARYFCLPFKLFPVRDVSLDVPKLIPAELIKEYEVFPLFRMENCLTLGICNPFFLSDQKILQWKLHYQIEFCLLKKTNWETLYQQLIVHHRYQAVDEESDSVLLSFFRSCQQQEIDYCVFYFDNSQVHHFCFFGQDRYQFDELGLTFPTLARLQFLEILNRLFLLPQDRDVIEVVSVNDTLKIRVEIQHFSSSLRVKIYFINDYEVGLDILKTYCTEKEVDLMLSYLDQPGSLILYSSSHCLAWWVLVYSVYYFFYLNHRFIFELGWDDKPLISSWYRKIVDVDSSKELINLFTALRGGMCFIQESIDVLIKENSTLQKKISYIQPIIAKESLNLLALLKENEAYVGLMPQGVYVSYMYCFRILCEFCKKKKSIQIGGMDLWEKQGCEKCFFQGEKGKKMFLLTFCFDQNLRDHLLEFKNDKDLYLFLNQHRYLDLIHRLKNLVLGKNIALGRLESYFPLTLLEEELFGS